MTELERALLDSVKRLEKESRERESNLMSYLKQVDARLNASEKALSVLTEQYEKVIKLLKDSSNVR